MSQSITIIDLMNKCKEYSDTPRDQGNYGEVIAKIFLTYGKEHRDRFSKVETYAE